MNVLLVEDKDYIGAPMMREIVQKGNECEWALGAPAANTALAVGEFDIVILDWEYGFGDGSALDVFPYIPERTCIIVYSGLDRTREIKAAGFRADHVVVKGADSMQQMLDLLDELQAA